MAEKLEIDGKLIGTTADNVEYGKQGWPAASNLKTALDDLNTRLAEVEQGGGGSGDDDVINVNGTWVSFGDSITALNDGRAISSSYVTKGYQDRVREKINFLAFHNYAWSGNLSTGYKHQIEEMVEDEIIPDYVTWLFGTNDLFNGSATWVGTLQDYIDKRTSNSAPASYASAVRHFVDAIKEVNPNVKIILGTQPKRVISPQFEHWYSPHNTKGIYQAIYPDLILQIADYDSRINGVCDFFNLPNSNESTLYHASAPATGMLYDGTHPSDYGMQCMADMLIEVFKKII